MQPRTPPQGTSLTQPDAVYTRYFGLVVDNPYDWIQKQHGSDWKTIKRGALTPAELRRGHPVGIRPHRDRCRWLALDIDTGSQHHPSSAPEAVDGILHIFAEKGIEGVLRVQSSDSRGLHLWFPIPVQPTVAAAGFLECALAEAGLALADGQLEAFPNRRSRRGH